MPALPFQRPRAQSRSFVLGPADVAILDALLRFHYLTSPQVTRLLYSPGSASLVRSRMKRLVDQRLVETVYLHSQAHGGSAPLVYTLARKGLNALADVGRDIPTRFRPSEKQLSDYVLRHTLGVNDVLIGLQLVAAQHPGLRLAQLVHERDLKRQPAKVTLPNGETLGYSADGWCDLHVARDGQWYRLPLLLELDRATEHVSKWRRKVASILAYTNGPYEQQLGTRSLTVAVVAAPGDGTTAAKRQQDLLRWTEAELTERGEQGEADLFRFASLPPDTDPRDLFRTPCWQRPFASQLLPLIEGVGG